MITALLHGCYNASDIWTPDTLKRAGIAADADTYLVEEVGGDRYLTAALDSEGATTLAAGLGMKDADGAGVDEIAAWLDARRGRTFEVDFEFWNECPDKTGEDCIFFAMETA